jgi:hypothetical protein
MSVNKQRAKRAAQPFNFVTFGQFADAMPIRFTLHEAMMASKSASFPAYVRVPHRKSSPRWDVQALEKWIVATFSCVMTPGEVQRALDKFRLAVAEEEPAMT